MPLTLLVKVTRRLIMQKARRHPFDRTPTACKRTVSGSISLPCSGFFSPFLHSTGSLSVSQEYLALADGAACFPQDFSGPAVLRILLGNKLISLKGLSPSLVELSRSFGYQFIVHITVLQPQACRNNLGLGSFPFARHYLGNHYCFLLLWLLRCFSSPRLLTLTSVTDLQPAGFPHSDITGSKCICHSPILFAAYHVLLRL